MHIQGPQYKLARLLAKNLPEKLSTSYFTNSGTEAIEGAIKLAKRATGRSEIISCKNSYHGSTQGALSIMGNEKYIQIRQKVPIDSDGTVFKEFNVYEKFRQQNNSVMLKLLPLIKKYDLDFLPKIVDFNKDGYRYKFVDGKTIKEEVDYGMKINQKIIFEILFQLVQ